MASYTIKLCVLALFIHSLQAALDTPEIASAENDTELTSPTSETITPKPKQLCVPVPDVIHNAATLKSAMEGFGTDKFTIVEVLSMLSNAQRQQIVKAYSHLYETDLVEELKSKLSGDLGIAVNAMMLPNHKLYAQELHHAFAGLGTDEKATAEILGSLPSDEIAHIAEIYKTDYETTLVDELKSEASGPFLDLLLALVNSNRTDTGVKNVYEDIKETRKLILAGYDAELQQKAREEETIYISVLANHSLVQLKEIFQEYAKLKKKDIIDTIKERFTEPLQYALLTIVKCAYSKSAYYADLLEEAMAGIGTNNRQLIRIIVGRSETDLESIKESYVKRYGTELIDRVAGETSGEFKNLLMTLLRKPSIEDREIDS